MNYKEMSDKQLCEAILKIKRPELFNNDFIHNYLDGKMLTAFHNVNGKPCGYAGHFSLSWADMGPLIVEANICLDNGIIRIDASSLVYGKKFDNGFRIFKHEGVLGDTSDRAYLRAAAIVYLMIKDGEK